ncbi:DNA/RNA helicase, partial [Vibrio sp. 10N.261.49.A5]
MEYGGITILADENQRLQEGHNSSLEDIRHNLKIKADREFRLTKNFRNTKPIAELAKHFYTGLSTGVPESPDKSGGLPKFISVKE